MNPLKQWRTSQKLRAVDVALRLEVAERTVLAWESGAFKPSNEASEKLANLMEVSRSDLQTSWFNWLTEKRDENLRVSRSAIPPSLGLREHV